MLRYLMSPGSLTTRLVKSHLPKSRCVDFLPGAAGAAGGEGGGGGAAAITAAAAMGAAAGGAGAGGAAGGGARSRGVSSSTIEVHSPDRLFLAAADHLVERDVVDL